MSQLPPALEAQRLVKDFRGHRAVDDLSLRVAAGEVVALLGPNGAGKSTTLKMCAGVALPSYGGISIAGVDIRTDPTGARRRLGYVPDVGGLFPRLTGWEHLELAARLHGLSNGWVERAHDLIDALGLGDAAGRRASTYSHGMGRKLAVAIATISRPGLLLLDEPFDGVDPAGSKAVRRLIREAVAEGSGILVSTHLLDVAERISDRMVVIRAGRSIAEGSAESLREQAGEPGPLEDAYLALMAETGAPLGAGG